jgi:hypothetical protein
MQDGWKKIGTFGVDSGQVLITDPCYLGDWKNDKFPLDQEVIKDMQKRNDYPYSYVGAGARTLSDQMAGDLDLGRGVVSSTGWGDGAYDVYALYSGNRIKELKIVFIEDEEK